MRRIIPLLVQCLRNDRYGSNRPIKKSVKKYSQKTDYSIAKRIFEKIHTFRLAMFLFDELIDTRKIMHVIHNFFRPYEKILKMIYNI